MKTRDDAVSACGQVAGRPLFFVLLIFVVSGAVLSGLAAGGSSCPVLPEDPRYDLPGYALELPIHRIVRVPSGEPARHADLLALSWDAGERSRSVYRLSSGEEGGLDAERLVSFPDDRPWDLVGEVVADLDGDGARDLVFARRHRDPVFGYHFVGLFGDAQADLGEPERLGDAAGYPLELVAGDIDGDGRDELITRHGVPWSIQRLAVDELVGGELVRTQDKIILSWRHFDVGDVDGDGRDDLLAVDDYGPYLVVLWGDPIEPLKRVGAAPVASALAGDVVVLEGWLPGRVMVAVSEGYGSERLLSVYELSGRPLGAVRRDFVRYDSGDPLAPRFLQTVDLDLDGRGDIVAQLGLSSRGYAPYGGYRSWLVDASGRLRAGPLDRLRPSLVDARDVNRDGVTDLVLHDEEGRGGITVQRGLGGGVFERGLARTPGASAGFLHLPGDVDGDGLEDYVELVLDHLRRPQSWRVLRSLGDGHLQAKPLELSAAGGPRAPRLADLDGDGTLDLLAVFELSGSWGVAWGRGDGAFDDWQRETVSDGLIDDLSVGDLDGDGSLDVLAEAVARSSPRVRFVRPFVLTGRSVSPGSRVDIAETLWTEVALGDVDGDERADLVYIDAAGFAWRPATGAALFGAERRAAGYDGPVAYSLRKLLIEDVDADGTPDLVVLDDDCAAGRPSGPWAVEVYKGDGGASLRRLWSGPREAPCARVHLVDADGDGRKDIVEASGPSSRSSQLGRVWLADGSGGFRTPEGAWYALAGRDTPPARLLGGSVPVPMRVVGGVRAERTHVVQSQRVAPRSEDREAPKVSLVLWPEVDQNAYPAGFEGVWRIAGDARDDCGVARVTSLRLDLPALAESPAPAFIEGEESRVVVYEDPASGARRVTLEGPDEASARERWRSARSAGGYALPSNHFMKLTTDTHYGPPSRAWDGLRQVLEISFDAAGLPREAKARGPGADHRFSLEAVDEAGRWTRARGLYGEARADYCRSMAAREVVCR
jgi:hypothetical protein